MNIDRIQLKPNKVTIESTLEDAKNINKRVVWTSEVPPEEEFKKVFNSLNNYVSQLLGLDKPESIKIETINFGHKEKGITIIISCKKELEDGTAPFCFNTPLRWINGENEILNVTPQAAEIIDEIMNEAKTFMQKEFQMNLFKKEAA